MRRIRAGARDIAVGLVGAVGLLVSAFADGIEILPLTPRSGPRGATMFVELPAAQTGVVTENTYSDPRMWGDLYQELTFGAIGTGVTAGDFDNDGRPDLFVVSKTEQSRLFRNLGDWRFEDVTGVAGLLPAGGDWTDRVKGWIGLGGSTTSSDDDPADAWTQGATFADVNNDGWLDLYVTRFNAPNRLFVNQRDGTFKDEAAARGLAVRDACGMAAFCDYDRDGWLDVHIQTNMLSAVAHPNGQRDYLFRNRGDGTFEDVTERAGLRGESCGHSATWWDFDGDDWPDLHVANDYAVPNHLYRNNRDGTFTDVLGDVVPHMPYYAMGSDFGDINNDGLFDFFVADMRPTTHEKDMRGMAGSRAMNKVNDGASSDTPQYMSNALYVNTGTGRMLEAAWLAGVAATDWTWSTRFEDLDNDGRLDLFVTNGMNREYHNVDLLQRILGTENISAQRNVMRSSPVLAEPNLAFRNLGDLAFEPVGPAWGLAREGVSFGAVFADFDGDGDLDIVHANYEAGASVLRNDSDAGHRAIFVLRGTSSNRFGVGATMRIRTASGEQVRQLVLARGYLSSSDPVLHFGLGDNERIVEAVVSWPSGHTQTFVDLPADRRFVVTEPTTPAPAVKSVPMRSGAGQFIEVGPGIPCPEDDPVTFRRRDLLSRFNDRRGPALAVADIDLDGRADLIVGATSKDPVRVARGRSDGIGECETVDASTGRGSIPDGPVLLFDFDGDGDPDLFRTRGDGESLSSAPGFELRIQINEGGKFVDAENGVFPPFIVNGGAMVAADFDRDGDLDLFLGGRIGERRSAELPESGLFRNEGGRFVEVTAEVAPGLKSPGMVTSALWSDVDNDGWIDLLLALDWGPVKVFRNDSGRAFEDATERTGFAEAGAGWWTSLAAADFNADGRLDYVAGNLGLNTEYAADAEHPALLFSGTFGGGLPFHLEATWDGDRMVPRRTRAELAERVPAIMRRFPRNDDYATASLEAIVGADRLSAARRLAATELRSGVFLSQSDGRYRFVPLPRIAQIAPLQGIVAGDFDGDGASDIFAVQNAFAQSAAVGRFDGGLGQLLRGDGRGGFVPATVQECGLSAPGDAKALVVCDPDDDGWPDFSVSRNGADTLGFRNAGVLGRRMLRVSLRGPAGNPTGVGARIELESSEGARQVGEITAGGGYFSQGLAACFFGYDEGRVPQVLHVRWPDGSVTMHPVPTDAVTLTLAKP